MTNFGKTGGMLSKAFALFFVMTLMGSGEACAQSILGALKNKVEQKVKEKINNKVEEKVDETVNGKKSKKNKEADNDEVGNEEPSAQVGNQKSDFVRGSVVVFEDVVKGERVGEFPSKWDLERGNAEIATVNGEQAIEFAKEDSWIKPLISKNPKNYFGDEFTVEFDLMYTEGGFEIDFMHPDEQSDCEIFTLTWGGDGPLRLDYVRPDSESNSDKQGESSQDQKTKLNNNRWHHYAISFNKRAIKVYVDNVRYINVPSAKAGAGWMTFFFRGEKPAYMKNVLIARGGGELYGRNATDASEGAIAKAIAETGKFVTRNILFETGKADLKMESMVEIVKVHEYMKANPSVMFEVQGHCDSTGNAAKNRTLSQERADAIRNALIQLDAMYASRLTAVGKSSDVPVASNDTEEGRAKNRRVEFVVTNK